MSLECALGAAQCGIDTLRRAISQYDTSCPGLYGKVYDRVWLATIVRGEHASAERLAILAKQRFETDIDAFVVTLDSFCDLVTRQVFFHSGQVMKATYGNVLTAGAPPGFGATFRG